VVPVYALIAITPSLVGLAAVVAVIRANRDDLPAIVRALMRVGPPGDNNEKGASMLPKHTPPQVVRRSRRPPRSGPHR
jgi:hypothetical protein